MTPMLTIRAMTAEDEAFVLSCSHVDESAEIDACAARRRPLFRALLDNGAAVFVAQLDGDIIGFAHGIPIEHCSWGPLGERMMTLPCLYVSRRAAGAGAGRSLVEAVEGFARRQGQKGLVTTGYRDLPGAEWFLPAAFFEAMGFEVAAERGREVLLWKPFGQDAAPPRLLDPAHRFEAIPGRVVVDLFWNGFCQTSSIEAERVRRVCREYSPRVVLIEHCAEDRATLLRHQIPRGIFVDGREIGWGYEAPEEGIRDALEAALGPDHENS